MCSCYRYILIKCLKIIPAMSNYTFLLSFCIHTSFAIKNKSSYPNMYLKTGAGRGLGRQYALLLARRGCKVVVSFLFSLFSIQSHTKHTEILSCCNYRCVTILDCNYRYNSFYPFHFSFIGFSVDHSFQTNPQYY